ncbi:hypothetical protein ACOSP7_024357 [Xanthoceras sorbifolium]
MDKSWMRLRNRLCKEYVAGVKSFMDTAKGCKDENNCVRCPCRDCQNAFFKPLSVVQAHLYEFGILTSLNFIVKLMHLKVLNQWINKSMDMLLDLLKSTLPEVKFPDGYTSNILKCVNDKEGKVCGLKSHDCHIILQRLLPIHFFLIIYLIKINNH